MEKLIDFLTPTTFSFYGYIVAIVCPIGGITFSAITGSLRDKERRNFHCNVGPKNSFDKNFLRASCFDQYDQQYNLPLPLYGFVLLSFFILTLISIIYSWCCVKSRVEEVEQACKIDAKNPRPRQRFTTRRVFKCYLTQLLVRLILGIVFILLQNFVLYPSGFPTSFVCEVKLKKSKGAPETNTTFNNSSFIDCRNSMGSDKDVWAMIVWIVNMILACLVAGEIIYMIRRTCEDKTFMDDSEFCQRHLFNGRKTPSRVDEYRMSQQTRIIEETQEYEPLIPPTPGKNEDLKNLDDMYVNLIIHTGWSSPDLDMERMDKLRILDEYVRSPENSIRINKLEELFIPNEDSSDPRKVLIVGCPGIGKTLLCNKLLRDLIKGEGHQEEAKRFLHIFLFHFRNFNSEEMKNMSLQTLLSCGKYSEGKLDEEVFQFILEHPDKILLVFDGLDELKDQKKCIQKGKEEIRNDTSDVMPFAALYAKLVKGDFLKGATVLTTTRPYAINSVEGLKFNRTVEILGFSTDKVEEYFARFFRDNRSAMERIWQHVQSNINLLHLCYIPLNCYIVGSVLEKCINSSLQDVALPTKLTEVYERALTLFICKTHPQYKKEPLTRSDYDGTFTNQVDETLLKLEALALKGIDERRLVFELEEVKGMENCGLLNRMPDVEHAPFTYKPQYCFTHLTMQEFVAARGIAKKDPQDLDEFISSKVEDEKWFLVIQFLAGLLKGKVTNVNEIFVKNIQDGLSHGSYSSNSMALLMMKCLYEANDISSVKTAADELKSNRTFDNCISFDHRFHLTPVECTAIVYFVKHIDNLEYLDVSRNPLGVEGCSEISKLIAAGGPKKLNLEDCKISDKGLVTILEAMKTAETCNLSQLNITRNGDITDKGYSDLCDALMDEKCKLTGLVMMNVLKDEGISLKLSNALKHENCKLTKLRINAFLMLTYQGKDEADEIDSFINFCNATLVDKNCKLRNLDFEVDSANLQPCISHICEVIKNENCRLRRLTLRNNYVGDEDISCVCEALKNVNCTFTEFHFITSGGSKSGFFELSDYLTDERFKFSKFKLTDEIQNTKAISILHPGHTYITDVGVSHLCDALKHKDCKLTRLSLVGSIDETLTSESIEDLKDAITHDNCKLKELTLDFYTESPIALVAQIEYRKREYACSIKKRDNGQKFLATMGRSGQYEEIDLSSIVFVEDECCIIKIYRHPDQPQPQPRAHPRVIIL